MKQTMMGGALSAGLGLSSFAWAFMPGGHTWNPEWLVSLSWPGMALGAGVAMWINGEDRASFASVIAGVAVQWLVLGCLAGFSLHKVHELRHRT
jgi:hypothetical protein